MKKYIFIFKATLIESLQYVMNILLGFITFFIILFVFMNLWKYIYSDPEQLIHGYSMTQMIWYVIITEIIWFGSRNRTLTHQVAFDIKSGTIAYGINKPYHYVIYIISKHMGEISIKLFMYCSVGILIVYLFNGSFPNFSILFLPLTVMIFFMGILINAFIQISISILSFWIEDSTPFHWIYDKLIIVIGILFPIEMFPSWARPFIELSPIYVVIYGPAKMAIDFKFDLFLRILFIQAIYFLFTLTLLMLLYRKGVKKINVNGG